MARIKCRYVDCANLEAGVCGADIVELDPEMGCITYNQEDEALTKEEEWEEEDLEEEEEEEEDWEVDLDDDEDEDFDFDDDDEEGW